MRLTRWQRPGTWQWTPLHQLSNLRTEIDRLFENPFSAFSEEKQSFFTGWGPSLDVYEDKDNVYVKAEVPGMKKEEIEISLHEGTLTLSGERKEAQPEEGTVAIRTERFAGRFSRSVSLPASVDPDKVKASYRDGILTVLLPKSEAAKPKQIQIKGE
jgi:HSP20 family protein